MTDNTTGASNTFDVSSPLIVTGTPTLTLNDGGTATYASGFGSGTLTFSIPTPQWVTTQSAVPDDTLPALSQVTVNPAGDAIAQKFSDSTHDLNDGPIFVNKVEQVPGAIIDMPASRAGEADPPAAVLNAMEQVPETPTGAPSTIDTSATITIANGASLEIQGASAQSVAFAGTTGTLKLEHAVGFTGQISGLTGSDALDLADVPYGTKTTATFSGNANGGTLTVTDGNHTAQIALLGDYLGSGWTLSSDGNGGTVVIDPSLYPNASNTGVSAGVKLTPYSGNLTITTAGEVVSGLIISNGVQIEASNVTLENCIIEVSPTAPWDVGVSGGLTGVVIQNCEIIGAGTAGPQGSMGIYVQGNSQVTINAVNMHDVGQGVDVNDGQVILENSYIHNLNAGAGTHYEDVGYFGAAKSANFSFLIQNNTLINEHNQTASVFLQNYFGAVNNVTVNNNILVGGDYTVYMDASGDGGPGTGTPVTNVSFTNNHMGTGIYGYTDFIHWTTSVYTGNINDGQTLIAAAGFRSPIVSMASAPPGSYATGNTLTLTLYMSEAVTVQGTPTLSLNDGGTATYSGGTGTNTLTFSYTVGSGQNTSALAATAVNGTITDLDGFALYTANLPATFAGVSIGTGATMPVILSVVESPSSGDLGAGKTLTLTLEMNEAVTVAGGTPTLALNDNGTATYVSGSGTSSLTFSYTVAAGQNTSGLAVTAVKLNGATVTDRGGNAANLSLTGLTQTGPQIETTPPTVASVLAAAGTYDAGTTLTLTLNMSEAVTVSGTPTLTLNDGGTATYASGSGTNTLKFRYTVASGQNTSALAVTGVTGTIADLAGNSLSTTGLPETFSGVVIGSTAPTISSVSAPAGDYGAGKALTLTLNMSEAVTVTGTPTLTLNDGGTATYASGSGTNTLKFNYTVASGQNTSALAVTGVTGTIADLAGNSLSTTGLPETFSGVVIGSTPAGWSNFSFPTQTTNFTATFDATPSQSGADIVIGLSPTIAADYSDLAAIVRFNSSGTIDVRNGSAYGADVSVPYTAGTNDHFRMVVDVSTDTYSVYVTPQGGSEIALATNYTFRTEQATDTSLADVGEFGSPGSAPVLNFTILDTTAPKISSVSAPAGDYGVGQALTLTLNMSEAVTVTGTPTLTLNDGGTATYASGSGTNTLKFNYTVASGQNTSALAVTGVTGTIADLAGNSLSTTGLPETFSGVVIGSTPAGWSNFSFPTQTTNFTATFDATPSQSGADIVIGLSPTIAADYSDLAAIVRFNSSGTIDVRNGSAYGADVSVPYTAGTNDHFRMVVDVSTDTYSVYVTPQGGSEIALATNYTFRTEQATDTSLADVGEFGSPGSAPVLNFTILDTTAPKISSVSAPAGDYKPSDVTRVVASPSSGIFNPGVTITITLDMDESFIVAGAPTLTLNDGGTATYVGGSGTGALNFSYTIQASDKTVSTLAITQVNLPNGATVKDAAGDEANLSGAVTTLSGLGIDPPAPNSVANPIVEMPLNASSSSSAVTQVDVVPSGGAVFQGNTADLAASNVANLTLRGSEPGSSGTDAADLQTTLPQLAGLLANYMASTFTPLGSNNNANQLGDVSGTLSSQTTLLTNPVVNHIQHA